MVVRAVVFDLFNTLTAPVDDVEFRASARAMGLAAGVDPDGFTKGWFDLWRERYDGTLPTIHACVRGVCTAIDRHVDEAAIERAVQVRIEASRHALTPRPDALDTLARLRALGLRTALISNCTPEIAVLWPTTPFARAFDVALFSCVEGRIKPDPALYLRACQRVNVEPGACLYVGDGGSHELSGAERIGMRAVLIRTPEERAATYDRSERRSWRGEAIESLSELPGLLADARSV